MLLVSGFRPLSWPRVTTNNLRRHRHWPVLASLVIIIAALGAGLSTLPSGEAARPLYSLKYTTEESLDFWLGRTSLVFTFEDGLHPRQCGTAWVDASHSVRLSPYVSGKCRATLEAARITRLHPAGLRLLWSLLSETDRDNIATESSHLGREMFRPFAEAFTSPYFNENYRKEFTRILQSALRRTWAYPEIQYAISETLVSLDAVHSERLVNRLWPIAMEKAKAEAWTSLSNLGGLFGGRDEAQKRSLTGRFLQDMAVDSRTQALVFDELMHMTAEPRVFDLVNLFAAKLLRTLAEDPELPRLLDQIAMDQHLLTQHQGAGFDFDFFTQDLPRRILRYRHPRDHNPLAAYLVRSILRRSDTFVVLMMTEEQARQAEAQDVVPGFPLSNATP